MSIKMYSDAEERFNYLTHGISALVSVLAFIYLLYKGWIIKDNYFFTGIVVYGIGLIGVFTASTIYHWVSSTKWKKFFQLVDHFAIYVMIAGTYTPFALGNLRNDWGIALLVLIWGLAIAGMVYKYMVRHTLHKNSFFDALIYVCMGCVVVLFIEPTIDHVPSGGLALLVVGGITYIAGVYFFLKENMDYNHGIWHLFVMAAASCHYFGILWYASPPTMG